jgi:glycosyltransferase involved in cell wall biosynthesis
MRIVFLSYNYSPDIRSPQEWIERIKFYRGWLECLAEEHTVIRVDQINYTGSYTHNGVQYHFVDDGQRKNYFPRKLNSFVESLKPDFVLISSFLYPLQIVQLSSCLGEKAKIIVQNHAERPFSGIKKYMQRFAAGKVSAFLFASYQIGIEWVKKGNIDREDKIQELMEVSSVFRPIDKSAACDRTGVSGSPVFLWVGRLNRNKDPLTAVKSFLKFSSAHHAAKLYMIFQTDELLAEIKILLDTGGANSIVLLGKIDHSELLYWFNSADFFISASHYEGSGTALCEAMSCGCIPVVTDIPSFRMISGGCGELYEPGNEEALLSALNNAVDINISEERDYVLSHFENNLSFQAIAARFQKILNSL